MIAKRNLMLTCGISQISFSILENFHLTDEYEALIDQLKETEYPVDITFLRDAPPLTAFLPKMLAEIRPYWSKRSELRSNSEIFGAELATLITMEMDQNESWDPYQDQIVAFCSDTLEGVIAAILLEQILVNLWEVKNITLHTIPGLKANPQDPDDVMERFARCIGDNILQSSEEQKWHNVFIITSGFKSTIPCMTMFAFLYGIKLVYLFERSNCLQTLYFRRNLTNKNSKNLWRKLLNDLKKNGWAGQESSKYMQIALEGINHPEVIF